jgi:uncharacterized damage-inducible protein DinB
MSRIVMSKQQMQTLFAYTWHTNQRLLEQAAQLDESDYHAQPGYGHGSIHDLFFHLLATFHAWRTGFESGRQQPRIKPGAFSSLAAVRAGLDEEAAAWRTWLEGLSETQIAGTMALAPLRGDPVTMDVWRILHHLLFHAMQHHTELALLLTQKGHSPGDIDFLFYQD